MTDSKQAPAQAEKKDLSPEQQAQARIDELNKQVTDIERELRTAEGRLLNRDPSSFKKLKEEHQALVSRKKNLEKALFALVSEAFAPKQPDELKVQLDVLRLAAVEFCKKANIDPEIWKSIAY